jgi:hypothetical protein
MDRCHRGDWHAGDRGRLLAASPGSGLGEFADGVGQLTKASSSAPGSKSTVAFACTSRRPLFLDEPGRAMVLDPATQTPRRLQLCRHRRPRRVDQCFHHRVERRGSSLQLVTCVLHEDTAAFPPETPPVSATTPFDSVTRLQVSNLFRRLEAVNTAALPHAPSSTSGCSASLYIRSCTTCAPTTLTYGSSERLTPEMESVWSWFDTVLGTASWASPRYFCMNVGADP